MSEHSFDVFLLDLEMETAKVSFSFYMCVCVFIATACVSAHSKILEQSPLERQIDLNNQQGMLSQWQSF